MAYKRNFTTVGTPTIVDKVVSGFSDSNYLTTQNIITNDVSSFQIDIKASITNIAEANGVFMIALNSETFSENNMMVNMVYMMGSLNHRFMVTDANGDSINVGMGTIPSAGDYWFRITYSNSTGYEYLISSNGTTYTSVGTNSSTTLPALTTASPGTLYLGFFGGYSLSGSIYLSDCRISVVKSGTTTVWTPYETLANNTITVPSGTTVRYIVSKTGYETETGTVTLTTDQTINVVLIAPQEIDVSDYEYTLNGTVLTLTKYVGAGGAVDVPNVS